MKLDDIQARVNALSDAMLAKGLIDPEAALSVNALKRLHVALSWRKTDGRHEYDRHYRIHSADTSTEALDAAAAEIAAMADKAERNRSEFLRLIAVAADYGKQIGMDDVLVNPLVEHMQRISKNALTAPGEREAE